MTTEVTRNGITFTFAGSVDVGQYVTGDYWALLPTVTGTTPASSQVSGTYDNAEAFTDRWVHGLMVNPGRDGGTGSDPSTTPQDDPVSKAKNTTYFLNLETHTVEEN